jgi:hypothetical protein
MGVVIMLRTQIQLTEDQSSLLKSLAAQKNISVAELIRQGIDFYLRSQKSLTLEERRANAVAAAGRYRSGKSDLSKRHDEHLAEAYEN